MGQIFNWFSWQLERRTMQRRIDSLLSDLHQAMQEVTELRIASHEAQLLLHDAERGAKLAAEEQDRLKTQLELRKPAESELERKAWELWLRGDDSIEGVWRKAELWLHARDGKRNEQENQNNGPL